MSATSAVNITVIAFAIAPTPAGERWAAHANKTNGIAELSAPMPASRIQRRRSNCARARQRNGSKTTAPRNRRTSTLPKAPKSWAATRMKRKEAPQIAPSTMSSRGVSHALAVEGETPAEAGNWIVSTCAPDMMRPVCSSVSVGCQLSLFARLEQGHTALVSHHVRGLESTLGVKLFQRHARGVVLTVEGRSLADAATAALSDLDAVAIALNSVARNATSVRVAALHSLTYRWLIPRLPRFVAAHPRIRLSFETGTAITRFDHTGPDLAIRHGAGTWPGLTANHIMDEHLFPAASPTLVGLKGVKEAAQIAS